MLPNPQRTTIPVSPKAQPRWFKATWLQALLLFCMPYVQVPLMWMLKLFTHRTRIRLTIAGASWLLLIIIARQLEEKPTQPTGDEFSLGWFGPKGTIKDGVARVDFKYAPPSGKYQGIEDPTFGMEPTYEMVLHGEELAKTVFEIVNQNSTVTRIELGVTVTFRAWDHHDKYGKTQHVPEETIHTGDIVLSPNSQEIRKYTRKAYVDANSHSFANQLVPLVNERHRRLNPAN